MSQQKAQPQRVLWIGYGELGRITCRRLADQGYEVSAARRSAVDLPNDITQLVLDVTKPESLEPVANGRWDIVVVTLTAKPEASSYQAVYVEGLANVLAAIERSGSSPLVLFASSTSVYAQNDGSLVDESSATEPLGYSGRSMLEAERLLKNANLPGCAIRFSGIYGAQRANHPILGDRWMNVVANETNRCRIGRECFFIDHSGTAGTLDNFTGGQHPLRRLLVVPDHLRTSKVKGI